MPENNRQQRILPMPKSTEFVLTFKMDSEQILKKQTVNTCQFETFEMGTVKKMLQSLIFI